MDFFESQTRAHRRTKLLISYFALAVLMITAAVYVVFAAVFLAQSGDLAESSRRLWRPDLFLWVASGTLLVIGMGSLYRISELSSGGNGVAMSLGGVPLSANPTDPDEKKLRNVVEEMALASGVPVPEIYVLPQESGINAFAAGHTASDAAIGVTQGCMKRLTRDELQGVIAHEFSHILNGDMRLNLRLMGVLFGILCLAVIGRVLLRTRGRRNPLPLLGLGLIIVGSIGVFFGKLIKSAVSRQREFLADASAVQFTRNPAGVAGALKKIGGLHQGSRLCAPNAEEASHLLFGNGLAESWVRLFSTHPPLVERIRAIEPSFDGKFPRLVEEPAWAAVELPQPPRVGARERLVQTVLPTAILAHVGQLTAAHLQHATALRESLPASITEAVREPAGASALIYALLLSERESVVAQQMELLKVGTDPFVFQEVQRLAPVAKQLDRSARLPVVDLAVPVLRNLGKTQYFQFVGNVRALVDQDREIDLFEFALQRVLLRHLRPAFERVRRPVVQYYVLKPVARECVVLLSALAHVGHSQPQQAEAAFRLGVQQLDLGGTSPGMLPLEECGLTEIDAGLDRLNQVVPVHKRSILFACAQTVGADGQVHSQEAELLRAIADALDCPLPPFVQTAA